MPDLFFEHPRLARLYDHLEGDRSDLDAYAAMVEEFGARSVLDLGCGTGTFACLLASRGIDVVAVDPAGASLDVARSKPGSERVHWVHGYATEMPPTSVDVVFMTGNVAQVFLTDQEWAATLRAVHAAPSRWPSRLRGTGPIPAGLGEMDPRQHLSGRRYPGSRDRPDLGSGDRRRRGTGQFPMDDLLRGGR